MAKYHINNNDEAKICRAQIKCRFGGENGKENHFDSMQEAEQKIQEKYSNTLSQFKGVSKDTSTNDLKKLSSAGVKVTKINSIKSYDFNSNDFNVSNIDLIDEKPDEELLSQIRSGKLSPLNF